MFQSCLYILGDFLPIKLYYKYYIKNDKKVDNKEFQRRLYLYLCDKHGFHGYFVIDKFADYYKKVKLGKYTKMALTECICPSCEKSLLVDYNSQEIFCYTKKCKYDKTIWDYAGNQLDVCSVSEMKDFNKKGKKLI